MIPDPRCRHLAKPSRGRRDIQDERQDLVQGEAGWQCAPARTGERILRGWESEANRSPLQGAERHVEYHWAETLASAD